MKTRQTVLDRIRDALIDVPSQETPHDVTVHRTYRRSHADGDTVALFAERVADYLARVIRVSAAEAPGTIAALLAERGVRDLIVPPGFPERMLPQGSWRRLADTPPLTPVALETTDAVLTTAALGIAVTGTLVLDAGPGQGQRILSLLPDYHLCVLREEQIVGDLPDALAALDPVRPLTFISGPSATSDIELDRVEGVHGPRTLDVLVVTTSPVPGRS